MMIETGWIKKVIRDFWKTTLSANIWLLPFTHVSKIVFFINLGLWLFPQIKLNKFCSSIPITLPFYIFCQISTQGLKVRLTGSALLLRSIGNSKNNSGDLAGEPFGKTLFLFYQEFTQPDNPFTRTYLSNLWFFCDFLANHDLMYSTSCWSFFLPFSHLAQVWYSRPSYIKLQKLWSNIYVRSLE